jgi:general secretion pathway protein D
MNRLTKEVLIDVKIYTVELSSSHKTGINWSQLSIQLSKSGVPLKGTYIGGAQSVFSDATFNISGLLNFLAQNGNVNSLSNPKVVTLNNQKAIISVGDTIYYKYASKVSSDNSGNPNTEYTIESKFVGVVLDITPQISDNGEIILSIAPRISAFKDPSQLKSDTRDMPPDTKDNTMLSVVRLKDNQTLVLGGLITNDKSLQVNGVPVLKEIPLVKYLFSSKDEVTSRRELVFVITPHIISLKKKKTLRDLGFGKIQ